MKGSGWEFKGKTIEGLIRELQSFSDQTLLVEISIDGGESAYPISLVVKDEGKCKLFFVGRETD